MAGGPTAEHLRRCSAYTRTEGEDESTQTKTLAAHTRVLEQQPVTTHQAGLFNRAGRPPATCAGSTTAKRWCRQKNVRAWVHNGIGGACACHCAGRAEHHARMRAHQKQKTNIKQRQRWPYVPHVPQQHVFVGGCGRENTDVKKERRTSTTEAEACGECVRKDAWKRRTLHGTHARVNNTNLCLAGKPAAMRSVAGGNTRQTDAKETSRPGLTRAGPSARRITMRTARRQQARFQCSGNHNKNDGMWR